jgi:hypothetical protein
MNSPDSTKERCPTCFSSYRQHRYCRFGAPYGQSPEPHEACETCADPWHDAAPLPQPTAPPDIMSSHGAPAGVRGGTCCCYDGDPSRCPIHQDEDLQGIAEGLADMEAGRVKSIEQIRKELAVAPKEDLQMEGHDFVSNEEVMPNDGYDRPSAPIATRREAAGDASAKNTRVAQTFVDAVNKSRPEWKKLRVAQTIEAEQVVIEIARELYDRFVMGGWEPQDAYPQIRAWLDVFSAHQNLELTRQIVALKETNEILVKEWKHTGIARLVRHNADLVIELASLREELERMKTALRTILASVPRTRNYTLQEAAAAEILSKASLSELTKEGK